MKSITIRPVQLEDAKALAGVFTTLDNETRFMLFEPGERQLTEEKQRLKIQAVLENPRQQMFVALDADQAPIGMVSGMGGQANRNRHSLYCAIGVLANARNHGVGRALMERLIEWAKEHHMTRIELTVMTHNHRAKHLYDSLGFAVEGVKRNALKVEGQYVDEYVMARLLDGGE